MNIALDVDGVLADTMLAWIGRRGAGKPAMAKRDMTDWEFWKRLPIDRRGFHDGIAQCWSRWHSVPPTESDLASHVERLGRLASVDIVTAREPWTDAFVKDWLAHHGIRYGRYVSVLAGPEKADLDYDIFVDDSPVNAEAFLRRGKTVLLYTQPWNLHVSDRQIVRVSSLPEVAAYLGA